MNKAFVKEDSVDLEILPGTLEREVALDSELFGAGDGAPKNYITPPGFDRLKAELKNLTENLRPRLLSKFTESQNEDPHSEAFLIYQNEMQDLDRKIRLLHRRIDLAEIIDPSKQSGDQVLFGATVTVLDENENQRIYRIVGVDEVDAKSGKVSWTSPIGKALLQAHVGDIVVLETSQGEEELEVLKVEFKAF